MFKLKSKYKIDLANAYKEDTPKLPLRKIKKFLPKNKPVLFLAATLRNFLFFILLGGLLFGFFIALIFITPPTKVFISKAVNQTIVKPPTYSLSPQRIKSIAMVAGWSEEVDESAKKPENKLIDFVEVNDETIVGFENINQSFEYRLEQGANGIFSYLTINYAYQGDDGGLPYQSTVLVSVPAGSLVIDYEAIEQPNKINNLIDKTILEKEIILNPGEVKNLKFYYKLPISFEEAILAGQYTFNLSKNEVSKSVPLSLDLSFQNRIKSYNPANFYTFRDGNDLSWQTELSDYKGIEVSFK